MTETESILSNRINKLAGALASTADMQFGVLEFLLHKLPDLSDEEKTTIQQIVDKGKADVGKLKAMLATL